MESESNQASVTTWINSLKDGQDDAATRLLQRYFTRLVRVTENRIRTHRLNARVTDEEDIVLQTFADVFRQAQQGKFPSLFDRQDLWQILLKVSERKLINKQRDDARLKRGGHRGPRGDSIHEQQGGSAIAGGFDRFEGSDPTPEFACSMHESCESLLSQLDDTHRRIALLKLRNYTNPEIQTELGCSLATVERRLRRIREIWSESLAER